MTDVGFRKRFYWTAAALSTALMTVVFASIEKWIPPRLLAWLLIGVMVVFYIAFYRLIKRNRDESRATGEFDKPLDEMTRLRLRRNIRRFKIWVAFLIFCLAYGLWSTQQDPLLPRIVGASVNVLMIVYLTWLIRKLQRKLN